MKALLALMLGLLAACANAPVKPETASGNTGSESEQEATGTAGPVIVNTEVLNQ